MSRPRALFFVALVVGILLAPHTPARAVQDAPAARQKEIQGAVDKLSSADPADREAASRYLWSLGESARAALEEVSQGDDIEAARRASEILRQIRYGIRPDT